MKKDFKILTEIGNLLYKEKNKPNKFIENDFKNISREEQELDSIKNRFDVISQYIKTYSQFNKRKNGIFIKYNKYISYNFNSKNNLFNLNKLNQTNKSLKTIENIAIGKDPKINILKVNGFNKELNKLKNVSVLNGYNQSNNRLIKYSYKLLFYFLTLYRICYVVSARISGELMNHVDEVTRLMVSLPFERAFPSSRGKLSIKEKATRLRPSTFVPRLPNLRSDSSRMILWYDLH